MAKFEISEKVRREKTAEISKLTTQAVELIRKAEVIAQEYQITFSWDLEYGMGGYFGEECDYGSPSEPDEDGRYEFNWNSSSQSC